MDGRRGWLLCVACAAVVGAASGAGAADPACGWAMPAGRTLLFRPDGAVDPRGGRPLPRPPAGAVAVYCRCPGMTIEPADFGVLRQLRLPYIVESGGRFGVLQTPPGIVLNYHTGGNRFVPGRAPAPEEQKTRT